MKSMTGFGRSEVKTDEGTLILELQSVNRKYLETTVSLPKEFQSFEIEVKKILSKRLFRGQVSARFYVIYDEPEKSGMLPNPSTLQKLKTGWEHVAEKIGFSEEQITLSFLIGQFEAMEWKDPIDTDKWQGPVRSCTEKALESLLKMKETEGLELKKDIEKRVLLLLKSIADIEKKAPDAALKCRKRLEEKAKEFIQMIDHDERILREVALFSEKIDITEEITRFRSHVDQYEKILHSQADSIGKKMDFLIQEMMREINTIAAKSSDAEISKLVVDVKSELERIREQIQNVE